MSERVLIVRTSAMGDVIHALPAVAAIRDALPETEIGWVIEERWVELLCSPSVSLSGPRSEGRPLVDQIQVINTKAWRRSMISPDTWRQIVGSSHDLRGPHYAAAIDFQGSLRSAFIARLSGAKTIYGFANPREKGAQMFYNQRVAPTEAHVVEQNISLAEAFSGKPLSFREAQLPRDSGAERECERYLSQSKIQKFAFLNPGAGWGAKQWPTERYGLVAKILAEENLKCFINYGPGEELLAEKCALASGGKATAIQLSLTKLIAFLHRAKLFIGGDTGPTHLAAALNVPVVALFGPTDPARNGPFGASKIVLRSSASETSHKRRAQPDQGLLAITVEEVCAAARTLMGQAHE
jgi:heptosyltransferase-1